MTNEQAKSLSDQALNRLMDELAKGHSETLKNYLRVMARFPRYSWGNVLLIFSQRPDASHVAGFQTWLKLGRHVKKGEKAIAIVAPMVGRKPANGELSEDTQTRLYGFRVAHVFDCVQTEGNPLPEFAVVTGDPNKHTDKLIAFVAEQGISLLYSEGIAPAQGTSSGAIITLLPNLPSAEHFAVLVHELAHSMLHFSDRRKETTRTIRETEAEAVAFVVCSAIGLAAMNQSADYIQLYAGDTATLAASLASIQQTATRIIGALLGSEETGCQPT